MLPTSVKNTILWNRCLTALFLLVIFYFAQTAYNVVNVVSWLDEGNYLMKSWWYTTGRVKPYSAQDATWYPPFFFYFLGYWQKLTGMGFVSGRMFSALLGILSVLLVFVLSLRIYNNIAQALLAVALLVLNPLTMLYYNTATPYAFISFLSLIAFWLILNQNAFSFWLSAFFLGALYFLMYFTRANMILGFPLLFIFQLARSLEKTTTKALITISTFIFLSLILIWVMPYKFLFYAVELPYISAQNLLPFLDISQLSSFDIRPYVYMPATHVGFQPDASSGIVQSLESFYFSFFKMYAPFLILNLIGFAHAVYRRKWRTTEFFVTFYFLSMLAGHFLASQTYCDGCIISYTNYFLVFGAIGAIYGLRVIYKATDRARTASARMLWRHSVRAVVAICVIVIFYAHFGARFAADEEGYLFRLHNMAKFISSNTPTDAEILLLGKAEPLTVPGIFMAGRLPEIAQINLRYSYKPVRIKRNTDYETKMKVLNELRQLQTLWTDDMLEYWVKEKYDYLLVQEDSEIYRPWKSVVAKRFELVAAQGGHAIFVRRK